jgi:hypothetical protein
MYNIVYMYEFVCLFSVLRQVLGTHLNLVCSPGLPQTYDLPASVSQMLGLQE